MHHQLQLLPGVCILFALVIGIVFASAIVVCRQKKDMKEPRTEAVPRKNLLNMMHSNRAAPWHVQAVFQLAISCEPLRPSGNCVDASRT